MVRPRGSRYETQHLLIDDCPAHLSFRNVHALSVLTDIEEREAQMTMKRKPAPTWVIDYGAARAHAIKWLGDRYLLAKPINGSRLAWRAAAGFAVPTLAGKSVNMPSKSP